jgi:hypothetical protein
MKPERLLRRPPRHAREFAEIDRTAPESRRSCSTGAFRFMLKK